ncbi:cocaine- and amphetamine-regulated transcript 2 [Denticeps clupeoides]|uniref:Cocaine- and amphetamine-regulated transcript protein n=1 Tax=Denticeps clupeoides TaxID=299321 RepID=A0AAY4BQ27_9TELE|nr:cocaine- and amphetamine-regulated transcript protein-like [Denticeps clupeoides]
MESSNLWTRVVLYAVLFSAVCAADTNDSDMEVDLETRAIRDFYPKDPNLTSEKQLLGALQEVLEKLQTKRVPPWEKKLGQVPTCKFGEPCAVRKGARLGKMCECPPLTLCHPIVLKCF